MVNTELEKIVDKLEIKALNIKRDIFLLNLCDVEKQDMLKLIDSWRKMRTALHFYGFDAVTRTTINTVNTIYWNDAGISDHGHIARSALLDPSDANTDDNGMKLDGN